MNLIRLTSTKEALRKYLHELESIKPSCCTCENLSGSVCQKFQQQPPEEWKRGPVECEHWQHDEIPF